MRRGTASSVSAGAVPAAFDVSILCVVSGATIGDRVHVRRINAPFWLALLGAVVAYVVAFYVLRAILPQPEIAGTLAALVLGGGAYLQRELEARIRRAPSAPEPIAGYQKPWWLLLVIGVIAVWLATVFVPFAQLRFGPVTAVAQNLDTAIRLTPPAAALLVGAVVGQRADRYALLVILGAVFGGYLLAEWTSSAVAQLATGVPAPPDVFMPPGAPPDPRPIYLGDNLIAFLLDSRLPLLTLAAMLGFWYGTRTRLQAYVGGLLRAVRPTDRQAIVELAYEEARAVQTRSPSAQERVGEEAAGDPGEGK